MLSVFSNSRLFSFPRRFFKLSGSGRGEAKGMGVENETKGQVAYENSFITDEEKCAGFSTVGNFFSYNENKEEAFAERLQGIPAKKLQPIKVNFQESHILQTGE